jgi:hypothetical protein
LHPRLTSTKSPALATNDRGGYGRRGVGRLTRAGLAVAGERVAVRLQAVRPGAVLLRLVEAVGLLEERVEAGGLVLRQPALLLGERVGLGALRGGPYGWLPRRRGRT